MLSQFLQKLLFVDQFGIADGKITLLGHRQIMLHASALLELQEIDESMIYNIVKKSSFNNINGAVEHAKVYKRIKNVIVNELAQIGQKIGRNDEGAIKTLESFFDIYGLGMMKIVNLDNQKNEASVEIKDSTIAGEWIEKNHKKSRSSVCTLTAGVLAGMFSYIFGKDVDCVEEKCRAKGNDYCLFEIA